MTVSHIKEKAKEVGKLVQEKAEEIGDQVREQTSYFTGQAHEKMKSSLEEQKGKRVKDLSGVAEAVRQTSHHLREHQHDGIAEYAERAAEQVERIVDYVEARDIGELVIEAERFARRYPEVFWGGAFILGLIAGRFLKSGI